MLTLPLEVLGFWVPGGTVAYFKRKSHATASAGLAQADDAGSRDPPGAAVRERIAAVAALLS